MKIKDIEFFSHVFISLMFAAGVFVLAYESIPYALAFLAWGLYLLLYKKAGD